MNIDRIKSALTKGIGVKLIAFVVAVVIWFNAGGQQEVKRQIVAPLQFVNLPDTLTIVGNVPDQAELSITATKRQLMSLSWAGCSWGQIKRMIVMVNLARATPGRFNYMLSVSDILLPAGIESRNVRIITPSSVSLTLERLVSKQVEVSVTLSGTLPDNRLLNTVPTPDPRWITISGPENTVRPMRNIPTRSIDLGKMRESSTQEIDLDYNTRIFRCMPDKVSVEISISTRGTRVISNLPPTILVDRTDLDVEVIPKTVSLTLEGPKALIDTLSSGDISVLVNLSGKPPGTYTMAPEIILPGGVEKFQLDVDSLKILISRQAKSGSM